MSAPTSSEPAQSVALQTAVPGALQTAVVVVNPPKVSDLDDSAAPSPAR